MTITSITFLFWFFPAALLLYYIVPGKLREYVLLLLSLFFYALGSLEYVVLFAAVICVNILIGRLMYCIASPGIKKMFLTAGVLGDLLLLVYYKYWDFGMKTWGSVTGQEVQLLELAMPLGISFFTFKAISYLVDIFTGTARLEKNPVHDALYLSFFGQVQSGPLSRYNDMQSAVPVSGGRFSLFSNGLLRFMIGFNKKILLANNLSNITAEIFAAAPEQFSTAYAWLGAVSYSLQLFFDFAGYSDMAIGLTEMFGYKCPENFNYPYMTESVTKFWRRWHISLSGWFRDYVYIPLGGSRNDKKWKTYRNLLVVWILTGIWHGAAWHFIAWGLGYFVMIAFERAAGFPGRLKSSAGRMVYRILTLLFINFQWVLFRAPGFRNGVNYIWHMIKYTPNSLADFRTRFLIKDYFVFLFMALLLSVPIFPWIEKKVSGSVIGKNLYELVLVLGTAVLFVWALSFVVAGQNNPFAYANF